MDQFFSLRFSRPLLFFLVTPWSLPFYPYSAAVPFVLVTFSAHLSCCFSLVRTLPLPSPPHSLAPCAPPPLPSWSFRPFLVSTRVSQHARPARRFRNLRNAGKRGCSRGEFALPVVFVFDIHISTRLVSVCGRLSVVSHGARTMLLCYFSVILHLRFPFDVAVHRVHVSPSLPPSLFSSLARRILQLVSAPCPN